MRYLKTASSVTLAAALMLALSSSASAEGQASATGTITGKVVDAAGTAVEGAIVRVTAAKGKGEKAEGTSQLDDGAKPEKPEKAKKKDALKGRTDAQGAFTLEDVPAGEYTVIATVKGTGTGRQKVTVVAGQTATVEIALKAPKAKKAE